MVKNWPANAGDKSSIPGLGFKILHVVRQLSPCATSPEALVHPGPVLLKRKSHCNKKPAHCSKE